MDFINNMPINLIVTQTESLLPIFVRILNKNKREHKYMKHPMSTDQILLRIAHLYIIF